MAKIEIWQGSATWATGKTAFGFYDDDSDFQTDAPKIAKWCAQRLGYPLVDIELKDVNFFSAFEEAVTEYGHQVYTFQIVNNLYRIKGDPTGSLPLNQVYLDDYYGGQQSAGGSSGGSTEYTAGDARIYTASLDVKTDQQKYNLLSNNPQLATATISFSGDVASSESISIRDAFGNEATFTALQNLGSSDNLTSSAYIWPGVSSSITSSANQFSASSAEISALTLYNAIESSSGYNIDATLSGNSIHLTQTVEGTGGNTTIENGLSNVTVTGFTGGSSGLNFESSGSYIQSGKHRIKIKKIYHYQPAAINRYFDPYAGTGTGIQSLMQAFGFGNYSPGVNFMLMPVYFDALKLQAIEFNDLVRKSAYHFELNAGKYLKLFPIPTSDYTLWFDYVVTNITTGEVGPAYEDNPTGDGQVEKETHNITDISNAPYTRPTYSYINEPGKQWIRKYALALAKEMLGSIRGKYQSLPIPGAETTLDYSRLLAEAVAEKEGLISQLREDLEATTTLAQNERRTSESEQTQKQYGINNPYQIYIH